MLIPLDPSTHLVREHGPFKIRRMHPGAMLGNPQDGGFGGLGLVDRANLSPGLTVGMHEHRNDEIISYLRAGEMIHRDSSGVTESVRPNRLMVMNAGSGFSHEENVPGPGNVHMLQIFVRPSAAELSPGVQFVNLDETYSTNAWRLLSGPEGSGAITTVRQQILLHDTRLEVGLSLSLPQRAGWDGWLYVFEGEVTLKAQALKAQVLKAQVLKAQVLKAHDAVAITEASDLTITATSTSDLVLFLTDRSAPASRAGTLSGR